MATQTGLREAYRESMVREVAAPLRGKIAAPAYNPYPGASPDAPAGPDKDKRGGGIAPAAPSQLSVQRRRNCKSKPTDSKGNGTGRKFVPWCDK